MFNSIQQDFVKDRNSKIIIIIKGKKVWTARRAKYSNFVSLERKVEQFIYMTKREMAICEQKERE